MLWQCHTITDTGKVRSVNEDSIYHSEQHQLWAVADGMGGHHRGDIASQAIVNHLRSFTPSSHSGFSLQRIVQILNTANNELVEKAALEDAGVIASTCAILTRSKHSIICSWVGDSRIYRFRNNVLTQLTRDHSYETLIDDMRNSGQKIDDVMIDIQTLTRGVGAESNLNVEHSHFIPQKNDRYLLCTDGLYKEVSHSELQRRYAETADDQALITTLHEAYLAGGARDNLGLTLVTAN